MSTRNIAIIFDEEPTQWGLRGDPFLWKEMRVAIQSETAPDSGEELLGLLHKKFLELTGEHAFEGKDILVQRYRDQGIGMSAGLVCSTFWIYTAFPLLIKRFDQYRIT